jgi:hypothetical protein
MLTLILGGGVTRRALVAMEKRLMSAIDELKAAVAAEKTVVDSAVVLIKNLADQVEQNQNDPVALQALVDDVRAQTQELADAVTPPAPAPVETPAA